MKTNKDQLTKAERKVLGKVLASGGLSLPRGAELVVIKRLVSKGFVERAELSNGPGWMKSTVYSSTAAGAIAFGTLADWLA